MRATEKGTGVPAPTVGKLFGGMSGGRDVIQFAVFFGGQSEVDGAPQRFSPHSGNDFARPPVPTRLEKGLVGERPDNPIERTHKGACEIFTQQVKHVVLPFVKCVSTPTRAHASVGIE